MSNPWTWPQIQSPSLMGILNATPDSFYDGGYYNELNQAMHRADYLIEHKVDYIDIGGESSRPGATPVSLSTEYQRCIPLIQAIKEKYPYVCMSIDTVKPEVAAAAITHGASIINDIQGLRNPLMRKVAADTGAGVIIMHMRGLPTDMQTGDLSTDHVVEDIYDWLAKQVDCTIAAGVASQSIALDPGIGFGKTLEQNLQILSHIPRFMQLGFPILIGTSRKSFIERLTGAAVNNRLAGSLASSLYALQRGAQIVRVHDVAEMNQAITIMQACIHVEITSIHNHGLHRKASLSESSSLQSYSNTSLATHLKR
jgi:dihydropteroate synthase